jgi:uncharacterized protein
MALIPEPIEFSWDKGNVEKNDIKHGVSNHECEEAFLTYPSVVLPDSKHSTSEVRFLLLGTTGFKRKVSIFFTLRGNKVRVISARDMSKKERKLYEEKTKENTKF